MNNKNTMTCFTGKQATLPLFLSDFLDVRDRVLTYDQFMEGLDLEKYLKNPAPYQRGRIRHNPFYPDWIESNAMGVLGVLIALVSVIVAIILLVVIVMNFSYAANPRSAAGTNSYADGDAAEDAMNLFCVGGTWYLNDSSMNLAGNCPDMLSGKVGYLIEIE